MTDNNQALIRNIVVVGGGSAGWMSAAALSRMLPTGDVNITLVESEQIGTIGVGEATIPDIINFNKILGIDEAEFIRETQATFKLGIEFVDWARKGEHYFHPFGGHGVDMNGIDFHQYWLHTVAAGSKAALEDYSICALAAKKAKFSPPDPNPNSLLSHLRYAYHFDATRYAAYLRKYSEKRGVIRVEGKVSSVLRDTNTGNISAIQLESGQKIEGDLFIDCSGFRSLLLQKTLGVSFRDWQHWLPCNRAQTVVTEATETLLPYTRSTAKTAGWQWRIPTQQRIGNGHIYCSSHMSDEQAQDILLDGLDSKPMNDVRTIHFQTGCVEQFWKNNCIGIGLSAGFLEPLESTSLFLIQQGISRLIALYPDASLPDAVRDEYNRLMTREFEQVRDFIILHYHATERDDSDFWNYCRTMSIPDSLTHKMELFRAGGRVFRDDGELFTQASWIAVMLGQQVFPQTNDPFLANLPVEQLEKSLNSMHAAMQQAVDRMPDHQAFINNVLTQSNSQRFTPGMS